LPDATATIFFTFGTSFTRVAPRAARLALDVDRHVARSRQCPKTLRDARARALEHGLRRISENDVDGDVAASSSTFLMLLPVT
jgi:hypothetical protein